MDVALAVAIYFCCSNHLNCIFWGLYLWLQRLWPQPLNRTRQDKMHRKRTGQEESNDEAHIPSRTTSNVKITRSIEETHSKGVKGGERREKSRERVVVRAGWFRVPSPPILSDCLTGEAQRRRVCVCAIVAPSRSIMDNGTDGRHQPNRQMMDRTNQKIITFFFFKKNEQWPNGTITSCQPFLLRWWR